MAANFLFFSHHFVSFPTDSVFYKAEIKEVVKHLVVMKGKCLKRWFMISKVMIGTRPLARMIMRLILVCCRGMRED